MSRSSEDIYGIQSLAASMATVRPLFLVFLSLFVVMLGYGIALAVVPFFVERLARRGQLSQETVSVQVGCDRCSRP